MYQKAHFIWVHKSSEKVLFQASEDVSDMK